MIPRANGSLSSPGIESDGIHEIDVTVRSIRISCSPLDDRGVLHASRHLTRRHAAIP